MLHFELVLPCYNEAKSLGEIIKRSKQAALAAGYDPQTFKLVLVENGSADNSAEVLDNFSNDMDLSPWFRVVKVEVNQGYGFGLWSGLQTTTADFVAWSHADQQCDPQDAFRALAVLQKAKQNTLVKGIRQGRNWKDYLVSRIFDLIATILLRQRFFEINAQPKVFPKALLAAIQHPPQTFAFDIYVLYVARKAGYSFQTIPVTFPPRIHGVSNWASTFLGRYKTICNMTKYLWELSRTKGQV